MTQSSLHHVNIDNASDSNISIDHTMADEPKDVKASADVEVAQASYEDAIDPAAEKRLVRKLDMWLSPMMVLVFLVSYLDRSNIGAVQDETTLIWH